MPTARVLYSKVEALQDPAGEHEEPRGWALVGISSTGSDDGGWEFVRVDFRQTPGGRIEEGDLTIEKVALARFDETRGPTDENGEAVDLSVVTSALAATVAAAFAGHRTRTPEEDFQEDEEPTQP
jgi:hypothetical protein